MLNKKAQLDDAISLLVIFIVLFVILFSFISLTGVLAKNKDFFQSNKVIQPNLDEESPIFTIKNLIAKQKEIQLSIKKEEEKKDE